MGRLWARSVLCYMLLMDPKEDHCCPQHMGNLEITQLDKCTPKTMQSKTRISCIRLQREVCKLSALNFNVKYLYILLYF